MAPNTTDRNKWKFRNEVVTKAHDKEPASQTAPLPLPPSCMPAANDAPSKGTRLVAPVTICGTDGRDYYHFGLADSGEPIFLTFNRRGAPVVAFGEDADTQDGFLDVNDSHNLHHLLHMPPKRDRKTLFSVPNPVTGLPAFSITVDDQGHPALHLFNKDGDSALLVKPTEEEGTLLSLANNKGHVMVEVFAAENTADLSLYSRMGESEALMVAASLDADADGGSVGVSPGPKLPLIRLGAPRG